MRLTIGRGGERHRGEEHRRGLRLTLGGSLRRTQGVATEASANPICSVSQYGGAGSGSGGVPLTLTTEGRAAGSGDRRSLRAAAAGRQAPRSIRQIGRSAAQTTLARAVGARLSWLAGCRGPSWGLATLPAGTRLDQVGPGWAARAPGARCCSRRAPAAPFNPLCRWGSLAAITVHGCPCAAGVAWLMFSLGVHCSNNSADEGKDISYLPVLLSRSYGCTPLTGLLSREALERIHQQQSAAQLRQPD